MDRALTLVTGANGFVGGEIVRQLRDQGAPVRSAVRRAAEPGDAAIGDIGPDTDWRSALGVERVIHCAARVHQMDDKGADPLAAFRAVNRDGTAALARQAAEAGVKRLVFLSSIKVNGETTGGRGPFTADDRPDPQDPYGVSKWEAEQALHAIAAETGLEVTVIRPPLVYGPGVRANFARMVSWVARGRPLPFGLCRNQRSLVAVSNLASLAVAASRHPAAAGTTLLASDGETVSVRDLLARIGTAFGRPARLFPVPPPLLRLRRQRDRSARRDRPALRSAGGRWRSSAAIARLAPADDDGRGARANGGGGGVAMIDIGLALAGICLIATVMLLSLYVGWAKQRLVDTPNERSAHIVATPTGGGIVFLSVWVVLLAAAAWLIPDQVTAALALGPAVVTLMWLGWLDDRTPLPTPLRFAVQFGCAGLFLLLWPWPELPADWFAPLFVVALLYLVYSANITNFMDGIDGIVALQMLAFVAGALLILPPTILDPPILLLGAAVLGFFLFNRPCGEIVHGRQRQCAARAVRRRRDAGGGGVELAFRARAAAAAGGVPVRQRGHAAAPFPAPPECHPGA